MLVAAVLSGCSASSADGATASPRKRWSLWPWGGAKRDATAYIEYQRTKKDALYILTARNTHLTRTIEGQMRTMMQTGPGDLKVDSQSFTLGPSVEKKLLIYPARLPLTYEVTAAFKD